MKKIIFIKPILNFFFIGLLITTISRLALFFVFKERVMQTPDYWMLFPIGLRMDVILLSYISFLPVLLLSVLPDNYLQKIKKFFSFYFLVFLFLLFFMELASYDFIKEYDTRPNKLFIDYLIYPKEVVGTLIKSYMTSMVLFFIAIGIALCFSIKKAPFWFYPKFVAYRTKLILFPLVAFLLFFGARSSLVSKRPINASNAIFSTDQLTNSLGLNSLYTVSFALYSLKNEGDAAKMYGKMDAQEAIKRVKKYMEVPEANFTDSELPLMHLQKTSNSLAKSYNVVVFLQESLGAEYVGSLCGLPLTPELDKLTKEGLLFTNMYCTGTRSVRGIEAVVTGFLPSPSESVVKLSNSQTGFYTLAENLREKGYQTSFIYGGMANFDNMAAFFNGNGFSKIIDEKDYDKSKAAFKGTWGYSDEDLAVKANSYFKSMGNKPFFSLMFSTSNHEPFEFPDGRIQLYDKKKNTVHNAMKYADFSIGKFFELAKKEAYFKNTIFLVIADHNTRTYGKNLVPINKFHIPALLIGPNVPKGEKYTKLCSQIDVAPTLLNFIGMDIMNPMPGRNLMQLSSNVPGRAIMQFHDNNAFRIENQVVVLQPNKEPLQFEMKNDTVLIPVKLNPEMAKDALAHITTASYLYKERKYRMKGQK
ncbi:Phosphoglycerol transferase MdoB [Flavobacterium glycines]|uniref:Phosphoglycerol transferase MdoB n=2 Tax=Flavobacterium glycines TaxID=551990 RepID=A0A1B9DTT8_9FLAO|nr:LTA synthase family protein [Flavobacterium glycines]OCB73091.1 sulfatase [Flavobacterium glycines]SDK08732.1 Phosphoglycerol transferase MdoB [Flavobacterium glycines]